jgi:hypothetical protein
MKEIPLSKTGRKHKGKFTIVDDNVYGEVNKYNWSYQLDTKSGNEYAYNSKMRKSLHKFIWELYVGDIPNKMVIDHISGNGLDNQLSNLRLATVSQNGCNRKKQKNNTSGYVGICDFVQKDYCYWIAEIKLNNKLYTKSFRYDNDEEKEQKLQEAIQWRIEKEKELHQKYAFSNRPKEKK